MCPWCPLTTPHSRDDDAQTSLLSHSHTAPWVNARRTYSSMSSNTSAHLPTCPRPGTSTASPCRSGCATPSQPRSRRDRRPTRPAHRPLCCGIGDRPAPVDVDLRRCAPSPRPKGKEHAMSALIITSNYGVEQDELKQPME